MISQELIQNIGWTLIHSLWQGLAIYVVFRIAILFIKRADVRYGIGVGAMAILVTCSLVTFSVLANGTTTGGYHLVVSAGQATPSGENWSVLDFVNQNIIWLIRFWMLGFVVGLLRIGAGLFYINRIRRNSYAVQDEWMDMVTRLSETLNISRVVDMAEAHISSPMVVGFMKPIILFPVGLLAGLSTEQVETILVHELSHIRRQDYIINLAQSVIETIFFFNPFALLVSSAIREERENCCDDMVIAKGISPISYVKTLAQLEAARSSTKLALGFAGNQNQLLNRIKRIMENSAKNDWGKGRFVPVALLFLGLVCASWLSISSEKENQVKVTEKKITRRAHNVTAQDTSREDGLVVIKRGSRYNSWHEMPPVPAIDAIPPMDYIPPIDAIPPVEAIEAIPSIPEFDVEFDNMIKEFDFFGPDSIPAYHFRLRNSVDMEEFEHEFAERFKEQFKDFYEKNQGQFERLLEDVKRDEVMRRREARETVDLAEMLDHQAQIEAEEAGRQAMEADRQRVQALKMQMDAMNMSEQAHVQQQVARDMQERMEAYNEELIEMLKEDGYISKDDDSNAKIDIADNGNQLQINGHDIKEKDKVKYRALHDKYFQNIRKRTYGRSE